MSNPIIDIYSQLRRDEGTVLHAYKDTMGHWTIGIGHNLDASPIPYDYTNGITQEQSEEILRTDVARVNVRLGHALPWVTNLDEYRFGVLQNMCFNMGINKLLEFVNTLKAVQNGFYDNASVRMSESAWYHQVGARARRLCTQMKEGRWI